MKNLLLTATSAAFLFAGSTAIMADDGICNNNCQDKGNKNGWVLHTDANGDNERAVPKGLVVSGENGRVDNGKGNGGENLTAPNNCGENKCNGDDDNDPND